MPGAVVEEGAEVHFAIVAEDAVIRRGAYVGERPELMTEDVYKRQVLHGGGNIIKGDLNGSLSRNSNNNIGLTKDGSSSRSSGVVGVPTGSDYITRKISKISGFITEMCIRDRSHRGRHCGRRSDRP